MKKIIRLALLLSVVLALLCVSVFASDAILTEKDTNVSGETYYETYNESDTTENAAATKGDTYYEDVEAIGFTYKNEDVADNAFALLVISTADDATKVNAENILYVNQYTFDGSKEIKPVAFPKNVTKSFVYVSYEGSGGLKKIATIDTSYMRGDVNGNGAPDATDANLIVMDVVGLGEVLTPTQVLAGDVNDNGKLDVSDAVEILMFVVGTLSEL